MQAEPRTTPLIIGYYPFRGQVQVLRLVCEYLHCPYIDRFFEPEEWKEFKEKEAKDWVIKAIPFLQHDDFVVTSNFAMITYVIDICDRHDLEGRTLEDKIKMDFMRSKSLKDTMFSLLCN